MKDETNNCNGIFIPQSVLSLGSITWMDKCLWAKIRQHSSGGGCQLSNRDLAKEFDSTEKSIANKISKMRGLGIVEQLWFNGSARCIVAVEPGSLGSTERSHSRKLSTNLYLMLDEVNGFFKIGISMRPKLREKTLQSEKPSIKMLWSTKCFQSEEKFLHSKFSGKRIRGEWFNLSDEDVTYIKSQAWKGGVK